jgi:putative membrane protein
MLIFMVLLMVLIIGGGFALVRGFWPGCCSTDMNSRHTDSALDILKRCYASGEINKEEYEQKQKDLT